MGKAEEWDWMDLVGFLPEDIKIRLMEIFSLSADFFIHNIACSSSINALDVREST